MTSIIVSDKIKVPEGQENNPCVGCGACCAYFRASFHWMECESAGGTVPDDTVVQVSPHHVAMKGTDSSTAPYCINLTGTIGKDAFCGGYATRSSTCRDGFPASYEDGEKNERCDKARSKHGLRELTPADWAWKIAVTA